MPVLHQEFVTDKIEILEQGIIQIRKAMYITDEHGNRIMGPAYNRTAYCPGQDISSEPESTQNVIKSVWTDAVVQAYQTMIEAQRKELA